MQLPFRRAVLRGLGVLLPPLLTIVILAWIFSTVRNYVLTPIEHATKKTITWIEDDTLNAVPPGAILTDPQRLGNREFRYDGVDYIAVNNNQWIPATIYGRVKESPGSTQPQTSEAYYHRYVELKYLKPFLVVPVFLLLFILMLYLLGRFLAYGVGRVLYNAMELMISQLPIIRTVYTSVKQVTDFVFSENETQFTRVVAVEYPRKGIWSVGFVTGDGMEVVADHAGEPILTVLIPTSPMPATGYTISVRRSETLELDITVDQAFQFIVSCGVVVPAVNGSALRERIDNTLDSQAISSQ